MRDRELFALGVRLFGIWLITRGVQYIESFIELKLYPVSGRASDTAGAYLVFAAIDFALAIVFLLWTRTVVHWSYGEEPGTKEPPKVDAE